MNAEGIKSHLTPHFLINAGFAVMTLVGLGFAYLAISDAGFYCSKYCECVGYDQFSYYHGKCSCIGQPRPTFNPREAVSNTSTLLVLSQSRVIIKSVA
jgi:hypothetical protein